MESPIDQKYRLKLVNEYLHGYEECSNRKYKARFFCPFCQQNRVKGKYYQPKGAIFWQVRSNSWVFNCINYKCLGKSYNMFNYMHMLNPILAKRYQVERWHSGTTGKGHNCPWPNVVIDVT